MDMSFDKKSKSVSELFKDSAAHQLIKWWKNLFF